LAQLACLPTFFLLSSFSRAEAVRGKDSFPQGQRFKITELKQGLAAPYRLRIESTTLICLHNILQIQPAFDWFCERFGTSGVTKLRSFVKLVGKEINPTIIEIDLDQAVLYYRPVGAVDSDLTISHDWAGSDLDDVASALHYAKRYLMAVADARQRFLEKRASWEETLALCREMEGSVLATPEIRWSLRGPLFSPVSEPETKLAGLKLSDLELERYGEAIKAEWSSSQTVRARIVEFANSMEIKVDSGSGIPVLCRGYEFVTDINRKPVNTESLQWASAISKRGILADVRYLEASDGHIVVTCQLKGVTASLVDSMGKWDGTYEYLMKLVREVERDTGESAVRKPYATIPGIRRYNLSRDRAIWVKQSLGLNFKEPTTILD
jgi:hypothetical protein